ncbi:heat shock factor 2-binding protein-like [Gigantopelta aegis]|uniref:heat shock factor 2-binding protein-like n=1 Tax=Gigantopelta aegis TaxID=1735272 RepID=UPI001B88E016|nr:heat shock factor 2-binding protein-like [Gigantopelta aegis]
MENDSNSYEISKMAGQLKEVRENYNSLLNEWQKLQCVLKNEQNWKDCMMVHKDDMSQLATEASQLKANLPKIINNNYVTTITQFPAKEEEIAVLKKSNDQLKSECQMWKSKFEASISDCQKEKKENLQLRCDLQELSEQLSQQSDFCSSLGSACCTLLWRVSRCEESIQAILVGTKVDEFLCIVSSTLESYVSAYKEDWPQEQSEELSFILALCGVITNVAASAFGRDFLVSNENGRHLIDTFVSFLTEAPLKKSARLKNLLLMTLYNLSINQKGQKYICSKQGIMGLLSWHLQEETDEENRLNTLRVLLSLVSDEKNVAILHALNEVLPTSFLQQLTVCRNREIQELSLELILDMRQLTSEQ